MSHSHFPSLLLLILCVTVVARAQSTEATLSGEVVDPSGKVIPHAAIEILNEATGVHYSGETNDIGIYTISILPPGQYRVQVSKNGFKTIIKPRIVLNVQSAIALNFTLPLGAASETVTVEAGTSEIDTTDASVSTVIDQRFVESLPLNGRSFQDLISSTPGVVTQSPQAGVGSGFGDFSINGQRTESNYYTVDGVAANIAAGNGYGTTGPATSGSSPGATALGTTQSLISVDALEEFRVQSSTYSAEYGRSPGGQISMESRSGGRSLHGGAYDYLRNSYFDANDWFNSHNGLPIAALRQNDFGGTAGGPFNRGSHPFFYFLSYEGLRLTQPQAASVQYVPDAYLRSQAPAQLQPILNAYPKQTVGGNNIDYGTSSSPSLATFIESYSLPSQVDSTSVRIDHVLRANQTVFFRFADTPSFTSSRVLSESTKSKSGTETCTLGWNGSLRSNMANSLRLGYAHSVATTLGALDDFGGAVPINLSQAIGLGGYASAYPVVALYYPTIGLSGIAVTSARNSSHQWNVVDSLSISLGRHTLKTGIDYRRIASTAAPASPEGSVYYESTHSVLTNGADFAELGKFVSTTPEFQETALYIQDEWRTSSAVNVSAGLRWEIDPAPSDAHGNDPYILSGNLSEPSTLALAPRGTPLWKTSWLNFAPRLGIAWQIRDHPRSATVLRSGVGVFFDTNDEAASNAFSDSVGLAASEYFFGNAMPFTSAQLNFAPSAQPPYTSSSVFAFPEHLQLPYTLEWNIALQQAAGAAQSFTLTYVGASGRRLPGWQLLSFSGLNPNFGAVSYLQHGVTSNYQALQAKFQRLLSRGVQALASYSWSHSIDFGSTYSALPLARGDSDFDVRNSFSGGLSWDLPAPKRKDAHTIAFRGWGVDGRISARSAFPVTLNGNLFTDTETGVQYYSGVDLVPDRPLYLYGPQYPGGRAIDGGPSAMDPAFATPANGKPGDAPRNLARGFGMAQLNLAMRREFELPERLKLEFRAEAFNVLNHPNFGYVDPYLTDALFGQATQMLNQSLSTLASQYQQGGPRSMQFTLKVVF